MNIRGAMVIAAVVLAVGRVALGDFSGSSESAVSTGIFGYDRAALPKAGSVLRTDAFVSVGAGDRSFRLDDLLVVGYDRTKGTAGTCWFYVVGFEDGADRPGVKREADGAKRELAFYWYDVPSGDRVRAPGWYDADGVNRWENLVFQPGDAFCVQGGGLTLETNGLVLKTCRTNVLAAASSMIVGNCWTKRLGLDDIRFESDAPGAKAGDIRLRTLARDLTTSNEYTWAQGAETTGWTTSDKVTFDLGEAFWIRSTREDDVRLAVGPMTLDTTTEE